LDATGGGSNMIVEGCFDDDATGGMAGIQNPDRDEAAPVAGGGGGGGAPDATGCTLITGGGGGGAGAGVPGAGAIRMAGAAVPACGNGGGAPAVGTTAARTAGGGGGGTGAGVAGAATGVLGSRIACGTPGVGGRGAGAPSGSATGADWLWRMIWLACAVPSALHTGQATARGIWPFTGSTSNLYFAPQLQKILISMRPSGWCCPTVNPLLRWE
jgi:hypothetical protein